MSRMKVDRKPPLPKSPIRLRPRRILRSSTTTTTTITAATSSQSSPGYLTKTKRPHPRWKKELDEDFLIKPEYGTMSCEFQALSKMVRNDLNNNEGRFGYSVGDDGESHLLASSTSTLFERGRFYNEYSTRRNERLKRKQCLDEEATKGKVAITPLNTNNNKLGVNVESSLMKKRDTKMRKSICSVAAAAAVEKSEICSTTNRSRYLLRSMSKENKKPVLVNVGGGNGTTASSFEKSCFITERKVVARRSTRI